MTNQNPDQIRADYAFLNPSPPRSNVGWSSAYELLTVIVRVYGYQQTLNAVLTIATKILYIQKKEEKMTDQTPPNPPQVEPLPAVLTVGMKVKVIALTDETAPPALLDKVGSVVGVDRSGICGSSEDDPFYYVKFEDGRVDGFWREELGHPETIHPNRRPRFSRRLFIAGMNTIIGG